MFDPRADVMGATRGTSEGDLTCAVRVKEKEPQVALKPVGFYGDGEFFDPPTWVDPTALDARAEVGIPLTHYFGLVQVEAGGAKCLSPVMWDSGGGRSMLGVGLAKAMGLPLALREDNNGAYFGKFWGPDGEERMYVGKVKGPVTIRLSESVFIVLPEIKLIQSGSLFILGTDVMRTNPKLRQ